jgi:glutamyl-tRNA synthetase
LPEIEAELKSVGLWRGTFAAGERERFEATVRLLQTRARGLKDFSHSGRAFFSDDFEYDPEAVKKFWKDQALADLLTALADRLAATNPFDLGQTEKTLRSLAEEKGAKAGLLINAARVALTGQAVAPGLFDVMVTLGRDRVVARLKRGAEFLRARSSGT